MAAGVMTSTTGLGGWGFLLLGGSIAGKPKLKAGRKRGSICSLPSLFPSFHHWSIGFDRESASFSEAQTKAN